MKEQCETLTNNNTKNETVQKQSYLGEIDDVMPMQRFFKQIWQIESFDKLRQV